MSTSPGLPTFNNWGWAEILKISFTLVELGPLNKNGLPRLSITRVTTHPKIRSEWQHTQKNMNTTAQERWALQLKKGLQEEYITKDRVERMVRN
jgi:hypothetical protein